MTLLTEVPSHISERSGIHLACSILCLRWILYCPCIGSVYVSRAESLGSGLQTPQREGIRRRSSGVYLSSPCPQYRIIRSNP